MSTPESHKAVCLYCRRIFTYSDDAGVPFYCSEACKEHDPEVCAEIRARMWPDAFGPDGRPRPRLCGQDTREPDSRVTVQCVRPAGHAGMCSAEGEDD